MANGNSQPFVPASKSLAEVTIKSILLGIVLSIVMAAANVYLGLYAGMTVSASIPAAVVSMAILRGILRSGTILENNIVQTIASAGESLAAGIIFTVPALVITQAWTTFHYWPTVFIAICGGMLGVVFMVPLRRALIIEEQELIYPEGLACAEVLIAGEEAGSSIKPIIAGFAIGGIFKFLSGGLVVLKGSVEAAARLGGSIFFAGSDLSPALFAVGYIIRIEIAFLVFLGGIIGWVIGIPLISGSAPLSGEHDVLEAAWTLWSTKVRYIGVGSMLIGGIWSIIGVRHGISKSVKRLTSTFGVSGTRANVERTDRDMSTKQLVFLFLLSVVVTFVLYQHLIGSIGITFLTMIIMVITSFFFVAVSSYIVGLVGSSNNPVSGMTICTLLATSGLFLLFGFTGAYAIVATLGVAGVVCCAACTAGDISQDLKSGSLVGATPSKMQFAQILGVIFPALVIPYVLVLLNDAYVIGEGLKAPQATLFASIVNAMFGDGKMPWSLVGIGVGIGALLIIVNEILKKTNSKFRTHVMPVAVGIYLPLTLSVPIFLGGVIRVFVEGRVTKKKDNVHDYGILMSSGLIAGEAIMGIIIAVLIAKFSFPIKIFSSDLLSIGAFAAVILIFTWLSRAHVKRNSL